MHPKALVLHAAYWCVVFYLSRHHINKFWPTDALNAITLGNDADFAWTGSGSVRGEPVQVRQPHLRLVPHGSTDGWTAVQHMQAADLAFSAVC